MKIGMLLSLLFLVVLLGNCNPNVNRSRIAIQTTSHQEEIKTLVQKYVAAINSQDWIYALNQHYIARCDADSITARAKFLKYFRDGRLTSRMELASLQFETNKISSDDLEFALLNFTFKLDIKISKVPYSNAQLKRDYLTGLRYVFGEDISVSDTDDNSIQVGNLTKRLLAVNNHRSDCPGWKIAEFTDTSRNYFDTVFDIDVSNLVAANRR